MTPPSAARMLCRSPGGRPLARRPGSRTAPLLLAVALLAPPSAARAGEEGDSLVYEGAVGVTAAVCTLVWGPLKVAYAVGGVAVSTLALLWTFDTDLAGPIFSQSVGGDYVVTPAHLEGRREIYFFGPKD